MSDKPVIQRVEGGRFAPGFGGRPKGARNKLGEMFVKALMEDFEKHGVETIETVRKDDPAVYVKTIAHLLPKEVTGENGEPLFTGIQVSFVKPRE